MTSYLYYKCGMSWLAEVVWQCEGQSYNTISCINQRQRGCGNCFSDQPQSWRGPYPASKNLEGTRPPIHPSGCASGCRVSKTGYLWLKPVFRFYKVQNRFSVSVFGFGIHRAVRPNGCFKVCFWYAKQSTKQFQSCVLLLICYVDCWCVCG